MCAGVDVDLDRQPAARVQPQQRAGEPLGRRPEHRTARARRRAGRGGARVREVIVHLPPHPLDLLPHDGRQLALPRLVGDLRLVREHGERRLQRVRQIAGLRDRAPHGLIAMLEQRVEIVDERLHFAGIAPFDAAIPSLAHGGEPLPQLGERRQAVPHHRQPAQQADRREDDQRGVVHEPDEVRIPVDERHADARS